MLKTVKRQFKKSKLILKKALVRPLLKQFQLNRHDLANMYLKGSGIEIGALHSPLKVPSCASVKYVDRMHCADLRKQYPELNNLKLVNVDILDDGETLSKVSNETQDFVIANHFLEHCQNPIKAVSNMSRVLKTGGILFIALPDKRYTFDIDRPVTSLEHVIMDYAEGPEKSKRAHFVEWVQKVNKITDTEKAALTTEQLIATDYSIHFHVWTQAEMMELFAAMKRMGVNLDVELCLKSEIEFIFILRKN